MIALLAAGEASANITRSVRHSIFKNPNQHVRVLAEGFIRAPGGDVRVDSVRPLQGEAARGRGVFYAKCASCHRVEGIGNEVGPDLGHMGDKYDRAALLEAIVSPSADLAHGYEPTVVATRDGEVHFGFVLSRGPTVTVRDASGRMHRIARERIEILQPLETSIMPKPDVLGLSEQDVADVAQYLLKR